MALIDFIRNNLLSRAAACRFKTGDQVQSVNGGPLMIVEWIKASSQTNSFLICCKWFDRKSKTSQVDIFIDRELKPFDWYHPD